MIAAWMVYCSLCALGLGLAAAIAERALLASHGPVRQVWVAAVLLSLAIPVVAFRVASRSIVPPAVVPIAAEAGHEQTVNSHGVDAAPAMATTSPVPRFDWRATSARFDKPAVIAWLGLSLALAASFVAGVLGLAWMRRRWVRRDVLGVSVLVSKGTGPAVVGAIAPAIVVPEWVLALEPAKLALVLRHEREHQRAGDGRLLTLAQLALVVMPWNLALWWQIVRLRVAVELDCDGRVLRHTDARSYGALLLEVARPRRRFGLVGATAFAERAIQLERRIRTLVRPRTRRSRTARVTAACVGLVALTAAWVAPRPPAPARATVATSTLVVPAPPHERVTPFVATAAAAEMPRRVAPRSVPRRVSAKPADSARFAPAAVELAPCRASALVDAAYDRLYDGIVLTPDQQARACEILALVTATWKLRGAVVDRAEQIRATAHRDSVLRALLTSDADRAVFDANVAAAPNWAGRGGRGRGGDSLFALMPGGGGRGVGGGARGGRGGGIARGGGGGAGGRGVAAAGRGSGGVMNDSSLKELVSTVAKSTADVTFRRLFDGIALTADKEAIARKTIEDAQSLTQPRIGVEVGLTVNPATSTVTIRPPADSALVNLLTNDVDRRTVRARIVTVP